MGIQLFATILVVSLLYISSSLAERTVQERNLLTTSSCSFDTISEPIQSILCSVESGAWNISHTSVAMTGAGCLLGSKRCSGVMRVPTETEVPKSPPPPDALNKDYQRLAEVAEKVVPPTWWRAGFDSDLLLLSHNDTELPRKQFNVRQLSNKKLRNMYQCVTRQVFIRVSLSLAETGSSVAVASKCPAMADPSVAKFLALWKTHRALLGGSIAGSKVWFPDTTTGSDLLLSASEVLQHFYDNYGGIWTGCFKLEKSPDCRGALAGNFIHSVIRLLNKSEYIHSK